MNIATCIDRIVSFIVISLEKEFILYIKQTYILFWLIHASYAFISNCIRKQGGEKRVKCKNSMLPVSL